MRYKPHKYQTFAIEFIKNHPVAAILLDMGMGKTSDPDDQTNQEGYEKTAADNVTNKSYYTVCKFHDIYLAFLSFSQAAAVKPPPALIVVNRGNHPHRPL